MKRDALALLVSNLVPIAVSAISIFCLTKVDTAEQTYTVIVACVGSIWLYKLATRAISRHAAKCTPIEDSEFFGCKHIMAGIRPATYRYWEANVEGKKGWEQWLNSVLDNYVKNISH